MEISYLGKDGFKIKAKTGSVQATPKGLVISHKSGGEDFKIAAPGEYEIEGISVFSYSLTKSASVAYVIQFEELRVLYFEKLTGALEEREIAELENIDIVIMPVDEMEMKELTELAAKLEPYYVLPYGEQVSKFVAAYEHGSRAVKSLNISRLGLPEDLTEVIVFE
jgi:L-ascorbate metabolism protein UlaG (beta-lactamase superfamily)